jgi:GMP synthase-like glutamine amidotransferase
MRVHWLQHAPFEDLGCIAPWLAARDMQVSCSRLHQGEAIPAADAYDWLVVMGGPMNVYEYERYPWLRAERDAIRAALAGSKRLLGVCLGAQLVADVLGGQVARNAQTEIGWFPVKLTSCGRVAQAFAGFPGEFPAFHWHADTFAIPPGYDSLAASEACPNQAFASRDGRVVGIQFHLEVTAANARIWFEHERPTPSRFVQTPEEILRELPYFAQNNRLMVRLLERMVQTRP